MGRVFFKIGSGIGNNTAGRVRVGLLKYISGLFGYRFTLGYSWVLLSLLDMISFCGGKISERGLHSPYTHRFYNCRIGRGWHPILQSISILIMFMLMQEKNFAFQLNFLQVFGVHN